MFLPLIGDGGLDDLGGKLQLFEVGGAEAEEAEGDAILRLGVGQEIGGKLAQHEAIIRHVLVQGLHHPVAVEVGILGGVEPVGGFIGKAREIEPMACPALAVVRAAQGFIDEAAPSGRGALLGRRQASEVKGESALQDGRGSHGGGLQACGLHLGENEVVDASPWPGGVFDLGQRAALQRGEGPGDGLGAFVFFGHGCDR